MEAPKYTVPIYAINALENFLEHQKVQADYVNTYWKQREQKVLWLFSLCLTLLVTVFFRNKFDSSQPHFYLILTINLFLFALHLGTIVYFLSTVQKIKNALNKQLEALNLTISKFKIYELTKESNEITLQTSIIKDGITMFDLISQKFYRKRILLKMLFGSSEMNKWESWLSDSLSQLNDMNTSFQDYFGKSIADDINLAITVPLFTRDYGYDGIAGRLAINWMISKMNGFSDRIDFIQYLQLISIFMSHTFLSFGS